MKINPDDDEAEYASFGKIVLFWGHIEASLAAILLSLYHPYNKLPDRGSVPIKFSTKISHAIHGYCNIPRMKPLRGVAKEALNDLLPLHDQRSIIVHGYQGSLATAITCLMVMRPGQDIKNDGARTNLRQRTLSN